jgi:opacity protein-like surface antigen
MRGFAFDTSENPMVPIPHCLAGGPNMTRNRALFIAALLGATAASGLAQAADPLQLPYPAADLAWTGFYVGAHAGYTASDLAYTSPAPLDYEYAEDGWVGGAQIGYDAQITDRVVLGVQLDATYIGNVYQPNADAGFLPLAWLDWQAGVSGRLGYLAAPDTLIYGRLGISALGIRSEEGAFDIDSDIIGVGRISAGVETYVTDQLTANVEATYLMPFYPSSNLDDETFAPSNLLITTGLNFHLTERPQSQFSASAHDIDWNGFYAGISGALNVASTEYDNSGVPFGTIGPIAAQGAGAGAFVGYNAKIGDSAVAGLELKANWQDLELNDSQNSPGGSTLFGTIHESYGANLRFGLLSDPSTLFYAKAGIAGLHFTANQEFFALDDGVDFDQVLPAAQVGIGMEAAIADNATLRIEGTYTQAMQPLVVNNTFQNQISLTPSLLTAEVGLAWQF